MHDVGGPHPDPPEAQEATNEGPVLVARATIKRHIRDMDASLESGGSEPKLLGDTEGRQWIVKARNSQQGPRMLASEYVAAALGARIGAVMQPAAVCTIPAELAATLKFQSGAAWLDGESFGSAFMDGTKPYLDSMAPDIRNRDELLGPVAIDTWLTLHDSRQARVREMVGGGYQVLPVDFGYSIGTGDWDGAVLAGRPPIGGLFDPHGWAIGASGDAASAKAEAISEVTSAEIVGIIASIPQAWDINHADREALVIFITGRREGIVLALKGLAPAAP